MHHKKKTNTRAASRRIVLVGNPNVGKSVIFGVLTGRYATVSNYPGTTVEVSRGPMLGASDIDVIDSPGVNSLVPMSEDERVTRDILLNEDIGSVIQALDAKNLRRSLLITVQLIEMGLPITLAVNMYDEAGERGIAIALDKLSTMLGLPVAPTIATQRWNVDKLKDCFNLHKTSSALVHYGPAIEEGIAELAAVLPASRISARSLAIMLLSGDATLADWVKANLAPDKAALIETIRSRVQARSSESVGYVINRTRLKTVDHICEAVISVSERGSHPAAAFIGNYSMHPLWGLPILFAVLFIMYEFVGRLGAGISVDFLQKFIFEQFVNPWAARVVGYVFPSGFIYDIIVGQYGIVTMAFTYAIAIILPIVSFFFIFFSILEDSGYLPRLAIMVDRVFKLMGLNGKAVLPMILGLGCDTMATMTTRILETRKERIIVTLLLALGVPCSAQLGVILGMLGAVSFTATLIWAGVVICVMFIVGLLASRILPGETSDFILEIPPMRVPQLSNIALKTVVRVEWYLKEAVPLFIVGTLALFALDKSHALVWLEYAASPVIKGFLGLPVEATQSFIIGFLRRDYGAAGLLAMQKDGMLEPVQVVVSLVTITLFIPCIANFFMIIKELGLRAAIIMAIFIFPFALLVGGILNYALRFLQVSL
ncbi:MAG: ferrous iron transport protein B [Deltaproteobacteria bacterium RIFCSPLOWO2_02_FULL_53_8]|nr:MAG: ferrous iron transport protein B [Deltaproteobacteria bacterium RIFCSPLOWO2_02_FULL_53_8]